MTKPLKKKATNVKLIPKNNSGLPKKKAKVQKQKKLYIHT